MTTPALTTEDRLRHYLRLVEISHDLASILDQDLLLRRITEAVIELSNSQAASILIYDEAARQLSYQVATNMDDQLTRGVAVPLEGSVAGWAIMQRQTVVVDDLQHDPRFVDQAENAFRSDTHSMVAIPMITQEKVLGVLEALNEQGSAYTQEDVNLLELLSAQAAVAVQNARVFQQSDLIQELIHEIRTPLGSLSTAAYLLRRTEISDSQRAELIETIFIETQRLNELASTFLDLARLESGRVSFHLSPIDLPGLVDECRRIVQPRADESQVSIGVTLPPGLPSIRADRDKLKQVLINLLSNAIKYNRLGGRVDVSMETGPEELCLAVADTGIGIPSRAMPLIFEKFYRVRQPENTAGGTGLGLSICKHIVEGHGGQIEVQSRQGEGSVFTVHLPLM